MRPGVASRAEFPVRRAVGVPKVKAIPHRHRPMIPRRRFGDFEFPALPIQRVAIARGLVFPIPLLRRHKPHAINRHRRRRSRALRLILSPCSNVAESVTSTNGLPSLGPASLRSKIPHCSTGWVAPSSLLRVLLLQPIDERQFVHRRRAPVRNSRNGNNRVRHGVPFYLFSPAAARPSETRKRTYAIGPCLTPGCVR